jgi:hypothetical protein
MKARRMRLAGHVTQVGEKKLKAKMDVGETGWGGVG